MGAFARIRTGLGIVALTATFALASPGVKTVRAEEAVAGQCSASQPTSSDAETQAFLESVRREQLARQRSGGERPAVVMLNNRGYNYGPPPAIRLDQIRAEARGTR